jgi:hypothetical protein
VPEADFVYNVLKFVEWPVEVLPPQHAVVVGIAGRCDARPSFLSLEAESVQGHPIRIESVADSAAAARCQVVVVCDERILLPLDELAAASVLTVSALPGFAARGGMIELHRDGERFRFTLNEDAVGRSSLTVSAHLRKLALRPAATEVSTP